jgi:hypothetical protein
LANRARREELGRRAEVAIKVVFPTVDALVDGGRALVDQGQRIGKARQRMPRTARSSSPSSDSMARWRNFGRRYVGKDMDKTAKGQDCPSNPEGTYMERTMTLIGREMRSTIGEDGTLTLSLEEVVIGDPAEDEVIVRVEAAPINPSDFGLLLGPADGSTLRFC